MCILITVGNQLACLIVFKYIWYHLCANDLVQFSWDECATLLRHDATLQLP